MYSKRAVKNCVEAVRLPVSGWVTLCEKNNAKNSKHCLTQPYIHKPVRSM